MIVHPYSGMCVLSRFMSDSLRTYGLQPAKFLCPWDSPGKNTGVGFHVLLHGIFPTQGSNLSLLYLLHWQADGFFTTEPLTSPWNKLLATHSSNLGWKIPGTEEPGMLQSLGHPYFSLKSGLGHGIQGLPRWLSSQESACNAQDTGDGGQIPGSGRSAGGGYGIPLQYSCLDNPMDRGVWWATVQGSQTVGQD